MGDTVLEKGRFGKLLVDVNTVMVTGNSGKQINVGFGNRFGETLAGSILKSSRATVPPCEKTHPENVPADRVPKLRHATASKPI